MPDGWSKPDYKKTPAPEGGFDSWALASLTALGKGGSKHLGNLRAGAASAEIRSGPNSVWLVVRWPEDAAIALRYGYWPEGGLEIEDVDRREGTVTITATSPSASSTVEIAVLGEEPSLLRSTVRTTPKVPLIPSFWPRDIYPLDQNNGPIETTGVVYAKQRESAVGIVYAAQTEPGKGTFLYLQNLTALNDFCRLSETNLRECVGGTWPARRLSLQPALSPIPKGKEIVISDTFLALTAGTTDDEGQVALTFLDDIAAIYPHLEQPDPERHDWPWRSEETLKALMDVEELMVEKFGGRYVRPYLGAEIPDSTVQLAVLLPALDYSEWRGDEQPPELLDELRDSLNPFYDKNVGSIVRYLPDSNVDGDAVDADHNRWKIDSWYLYRPMMQLANLADRGNESERDLFLNSLDYGMKVAHRFKYQWPVNFSTITLEPVETERDSEVPAQLGETDVAGLYAYTMLDAHQLTGEDKYLDEAQAALDRMRGLGFEIGYQFNNVAWGMAAAIRLWQLRHDDEHLERACVLMASLIQHSQLWESECGPARHFPNFFGVNCLHDAAYSAPFEEFEIYLAFHEVLRAGGELPRSIVLLRRVLPARAEPRVVLLSVGAAGGGDRHRAAAGADRPRPLDAARGPLHRRPADGAGRAGGVRLRPRLHPHHPRVHPAAREQGAALLRLPDP